MPGANNNDPASDAPNAPDGSDDAAKSKAGAKSAAKKKPPTTASLRESVLKRLEEQKKDMAEAAEAANNTATQFTSRLGESGQFDLLQEAYNEQYPGEPGFNLNPVITAQNFNHATLTTHLRDVVPRQHRNLSNFNLSADPNDTVAKLNEQMTADADANSAVIRTYTDGYPPAALQKLFRHPVLEAAKAKLEQTVTEATKDLETLTTEETAFNAQVSEQKARAEARGNAAAAENPDAAPTTGAATPTPQPPTEPTLTEEQIKVRTDSFAQQKLTTQGRLDKAKADQEELDKLAAGYAESREQFKKEAEKANVSQAQLRQDLSDFTKYKTSDARYHNFLTEANRVGSPKDIDTVDFTTGKTKKPEFNDGTRRVGSLLSGHVRVHFASKGKGDLTISFVPTDPIRNFFNRLLHKGGESDSQAFEKAMLTVAALKEAGCDTYECSKGTPTKRAYYIQKIADNMGMKLTVQVHRKGSGKDHAGKPNTVLQNLSKHEMRQGGYQKSPSLLSSIYNDTWDDSFKKDFDKAWAKHAGKTTSALNQTPLLERAHFKKEGSSSAGSELTGDKPIIASPGGGGRSHSSSSPPVK